MGLKLCYLLMDTRPGVAPRRPPGEAIQALFERWQIDFFSARALYLTLDEAERVDFVRLDPAARFGTQPLWRGESVDEARPLTLCDPGDSAALAAEAAAHLASRSPRAIHLTAEGALRHRAAGDLEPRWYGRLRVSEPPALVDLVEVRIEWTEARCQLEVAFPLSGYPLTSTAPRPDGGSGPGDPAAATADRALILPALALAPAIFGLGADEVRWTDDGDYAGLFPDDAAELRQGWLPRLQSGELSAGPAGTPPDGGPATPPSVTEEDVRSYLDVLASGSRDARAISLRVLAREPTGDARVREALVPLLDDTTPCLLQIPYRFGEIRLLAGAALAAERSAAGDDRPVKLRCAPPSTSDELEAARAAAGVKRPPYPGDPIAWQLEIFALLREHGALGDVDLELGDRRSTAGP